MVALYVKGVVVLTKRGDKWPVGRTVAFALGVTATILQLAVVWVCMHNSHFRIT
jgi:cytochrome c oxidase assembly factor CtaG